MVPSTHDTHRTHLTHLTHLAGLTHLTGLTHHAGHAQRGSVRGPLAVTAAVVGVVLAACGPQPDGGAATSPIHGRASPGDGQTPSEESDQPGDGTAPAEPTGQDVAAMAFAECETERYTVGHPADWNTNRGDGLLGPCEIFHPGDIDVPERPRDLDLHYAAVMYVDDIDFDEHLVADNLNEVFQERETTVEGRRALVAERRSTGHALTPEGESSYTWVIDLDGQILVTATTSVGETDYARDKRVLDRMVTEELTIHATPS